MSPKNAAHFSEPAITGQCSRLFCNVKAKSIILVTHATSHARITATTTEKSTNKTTNS